jgi:hypothetical protein
MKETKNTTWKQKLNSDNTIKNEIYLIFKEAKKNKIPFKEILNKLEPIYRKQMYTSLPNYMISGINGYIAANFKIMYEYVTWSHWYNGVFVGTKLKYDKNFNQKLVVSEYVYNGTKNIY